MGTTIKVQRYSESFKRQVVQEYEEGASASSLQRKYGIGGVITIKNWVKAYGKEGFRTEKVPICSPEGQPSFQQMAQRIKALESALAESILEARMLQAIIDAVSEHLNLDVKKLLATGDSPGNSEAPRYSPLGLPMV